MRWHVHGTDASTGEPVVLGVNEPEATHAVQSALSRRILVSHVVRGGWLGLLNKESLRRATLPLLAAAVIVLIPLAGTLYYLQRTTRHDLSGAQNEQSQLAISLRQSEALLRASQTHLAQLEAAGDGHAQQLADEIAQTRQQLADRETQLAAARGTLAALQKTAGTLPALQTDLETARKKLADAQARIKSLDTQVTDQRNRMAALEPAQKKAVAAEARATQLDTQIRTLTSQIDLLKTQLLELAVHSEPHPEPKPALENPIATPSSSLRRWALRPNYDIASDFAALQFGKDSVQTASSGNDVTVTATSPANACTLILKTDRHNVYAATLKFSLAPGARPEKLIQNSGLLAAFAQTFAPTWKNAVPTLTAAMKSLDGKDLDQRLVFLGDDYKATLYNDKFGLYTLRVESPRDTLDED